MLGRFGLAFLTCYHGGVYAISQMPRYALVHIAEHPIQSTVCAYTAYSMPSIE